MAHVIHLLWPLRPSAIPDPRRAHGPRPPTLPRSMANSIQTPSAKLQAPSSKLQAPNSKLQAPNSKLQAVPFSAGGATPTSAHARGSGMIGFVPLQEFLQLQSDCRTRNYRIPYVTSCSGYAPPPRRKRQVEQRAKQRGCSM